jgi:hypothetical protein
MIIRSKVHEQISSPNAIWEKNLKGEEKKEKNVKGKERKKGKRKSEKENGK